MPQACTLRTPGMRSPLFSADLTAGSNVWPACTEHQCVQTVAPFKLHGIPAWSSQLNLLLLGGNQPQIQCWGQALTAHFTQRHLLGSAAACPKAESGTAWQATASLPCTCAAKAQVSASELDKAQAPANGPLALRLDLYERRPTAGALPGDVICCHSRRPRV